MEVGEYIRTPYGIRKIKKITKDDGYGKARVKVIELDNILDTIYKFDYTFYTDEKIIKEAKHSLNIIDLIKKNDLVEIEYYAERYKERITRVFVVDYVIKKDICFANSHCQFNIFDGEWSEHDKKLKPIIKSIVTKEQFEEMSYKVK